jgi:hypothetical protein
MDLTNVFRIISQSFASMVTKLVMSGENVSFVCVEECFGCVALAKFASRDQRAFNNLRRARVTNWSRGPNSLNSVSSQQIKRLAGSLRCAMQRAKDEPAFSKD